MVAPYLAPAEMPPLAMLAGTAWLGLPFDALRAQHAGAVQAGFIARSLLESASFERALAGLEQCVWGPLARRT